MRITVPGRPQSKLRNAKGEELRAAHHYHDAVRRAAVAAGLGKNGHPHSPAGQVAVWVTFVYASLKLALPPTAWSDEGIPNAHRAPKIALLALTGLAWTHESQVNPLIIIRSVLTPEECRHKYGSPDGCTIIEIED